LWLVVAVDLEIQALLVVVEVLVDYKDLLVNH
jgi:hypothetical protein